MLDLNPVYNYYSSVTSLSTQNKYDSHKKSELKSLYNNMVRSNTKSPLFKVKVTDSIQNYAIGLKSAALDLRNYSEFLSDQDEDAFSKLHASSDQVRALSGMVITKNYDALPEQMQFTVEQLAKPQINEGTLRPSSEKSIAAGSYQFGITSHDRTNHFDLRVKEEDTNLVIQNRLANFIDQADIGIDAYVEQKGTQSRLILASKEEGTEHVKNGHSFEIYDEKENGLVSSYGLDQVKQYPTDAHFTINQTEQTASSNNIAINKMVEIELKETTKDPVTLRFVPDTDDILKKVQHFADAYNQILTIAESNSEQIGAKKLLHELKGIANKNISSLESVGLTISDDGHMGKDDALIVQSVSNGEIQSFFKDLSGFQADLLDKTEQISLDPMSYVDQTVISYPNPKHAFSNPYMPSIYSGMLYNYYA